MKKKIPCEVDTFKLMYNIMAMARGKSSSSKRNFLITRWNICTI